MPGKSYNYGIRFNDEVPTIHFAGTTIGTFTLRFGGRTTSAITFNCSLNGMMAAVKSALKALDAIDTVTVKPGRRALPPLSSSSPRAENGTSQLISGQFYGGLNPMTFWETTWDGARLYQILDPGTGSLLCTPTEVTFNGEGTLNLSGAINILTSPGTMPAEPTGAITYSTNGLITATDIQNALLALNSIDTGEVAVVGAGSASQTTAAYLITFGGYTASGIGWNFNASQIHSALTSVPSIGAAGAIAITSNCDRGFTSTLQGFYQGINVDPMRAELTQVMAPGGVAGSLMGVRGKAMTACGAEIGVRGVWDRGTAGMVGTVDMADVSGMLLTIAVLIDGVGGVTPGIGSSMVLGGGSARGSGYSGGVAASVAGRWPAWAG